MTSRRLVIVAAMMAATAGYLRLAATTDLFPSARLRALPLELSGWRGQDLPRLDRETEKVLQADAYLWRSYMRGAAQVSLFVAYYANQRSGHTIHSPLNCLPGTGWEWIERGRERVTVDPGGEIDTNCGIVRRNGEGALVCYWYQSRGRAVASEYLNKLLLMRDALTIHRSDGALVRVTAASQPGDQRFSEHAASFIRVVHPALTRQLPE